MFIKTPKRGSWAIEKNIDCFEEQCKFVKSAYPTWAKDFKKIAMTKVVFHIPTKMVGSFREHRFLSFFKIVEEVLLSRGGSVEIVARKDDFEARLTRDWGDHFNDGNLHIIENGTVHANGVLNTTLCYVDPFFHLYSEGVLCDSPMGKLKYDPSEVSAEEANDFFKHLRRRYVKKRHSRYIQKRKKEDIPAGCIAIFLQGTAPEKQGSANFSTKEMVNAVVEQAEDRPVVIKAHPIASTLDHASLLENLPNCKSEVLVSDANVHDILSACAVNVSFNSAVAMEGLMHRKPGIICGKADFHHRFTTVANTDEMPDALRQSIGKKGGEAKYLYWYLKQQLDLESENFVDELFARFSEAGFPPSRLGLDTD